MRDWHRHRKGILIIDDPPGLEPTTPEMRDKVVAWYDQYSKTKGEKPMTDEQLLKVMEATIRGVAFYQNNVFHEDIVDASGIQECYGHDVTQEQSQFITRRGYVRWFNTSLDAASRKRSAKALLAYVRERCEGMVEL